MVLSQGLQSDGGWSWNSEDWSSWGLTGASLSLLRVGCVLSPHGPSLGFPCSMVALGQSDGFPGGSGLQDNTSSSKVGGKLALA